MLYSGILILGYIALGLGFFVVSRKLVAFLFSLLFGDNYTIRYRTDSGKIKTARLRAARGLDVDAIIEAIEADSKKESTSS